MLVLINIIQLLPFPCLLPRGDLGLAAPVLDLEMELVTDEEDEDEGTVE